MITYHTLEAYRRAYPYDKTAKNHMTLNSWRRETKIGWAREYLMYARESNKIPGDKDEAIEIIIDVLMEQFD